MPGSVASDIALCVSGLYLDNMNHSAFVKRLYRLLQSDESMVDEGEVVASIRGRGVNMMVMSLWEKALIDDAKKVYEELNTDDAFKVVQSVSYFLTLLRNMWSKDKEVRARDIIGVLDWS